MMNSSILRSLHGTKTKKYGVTMIKGERDFRIGCHKTLLFTTFFPLCNCKLWKAMLNRTKVRASRSAFLGTKSLPAFLAQTQLFLTESAYFTHTPQNLNHHLHYSLTHSQNCQPAATSLRGVSASRAAAFDASLQRHNLYPSTPR